MYPERAIPPIMMLPTATTVAGDEPDTAANSAHASSAAIASPPRKCPTSAFAKAIMRFATPPVVMKVPARMKNGIASSAGVCAALKNRCASATKD